MDRDAIVTEYRSIREKTESLATRMVKSLFKDDIVVAARELGRFHQNVIPGFGLVLYDTTDRSSERFQVIDLNLSRTAFPGSVFAGRIHRPNPNGG